MNSKNNLFFLLLLLCSLFGCEKTNDYFSDENSDFFFETIFLDNDKRLLDYNAVSTIERVPVFIEEFDDNISQFPYKVGTYSDKTVNIVDGKMIIKYFVNNGYMYSDSIPIKIDRSRNFEMETSLIIYRDSLRQTITWLYNRATGKDYTINYAHGKDKVEMINLWKQINTWESINGYNFNAKNFLNSNEFTVLTIRKIGNKYAIFINQKLFYIINDKNFNYIPTITMDDSVINVFDYFRVYYLP